MSFIILSLSLALSLLPLRAFPHISLSLPLSSYPPLSPLTFLSLPPYLSLPSPYVELFGTGGLEDLEVDSVVGRESRAGKKSRLAWHVTLSPVLVLFTQSNYSFFLSSTIIPSSVPYLFCCMIEGCRSKESDSG